MNHYQSNGYAHASLKGLPRLTRSRRYQWNALKKRALSKSICRMLKELDGYPGRSHSYDPHIHPSAHRTRATDLIVSSSRRRRDDGPYNSI